MRVGWLQDYPPYKGGAELTADEFLRRTPPGVRVDLCVPDNINRASDVYVLHNVADYTHGELTSLEKPFVKYFHDLWPHVPIATLDFIISDAEHLVFTSHPHIG